MKSFAYLLAATALLITSTAQAQQHNPHLNVPDIVEKAPGATLDDRLNCDKPIIDPERPMPMTQAKYYAKPDLAVRGDGALTSQIVDLQGGDLDNASVEFTHVVAIDNLAFCDAGESRMKAIMKLDGGRWLGEARSDVAIARKSTEVVHFTFNFPLSKILTENCDITRDDYVMTVSADYRGVIDEVDETNNTALFDAISTASDDMCPREIEDSDDGAKTGPIKRDGPKKPF